MEDEKMCRIPVKATYRIIDGEPVMIDAEWADIPADQIARMFLLRFGKAAIFGEGAKD